MPIKGAESFSFGASAALVGTALGAILTLAFQMTAARHLSAAGFGEFAYASSLLNIGGLIAPLGFQVTILKHMVNYRLTEDGRRAAALLQVARRWTLLGSAVMVALIVAIAVGGASGNSMSAMLVLACAVPFSGLTKIETARLRTKGHSTLAIFLEVPMREAVASLLFILAILLGRTGALDVAVCYTAAIALGFLVAISQHRNSTAPAGPAVGKPREWYSIALSALVSTAALQLLRRMDIIIVASVSGHTEAGVYAAATRIADAIQLPLVAATFMAAPKIAELYGQKRLAELQQLVGKVGWFALILSCVGALPLLLLPAEILKLFGPEFVAGDDALRWLVIGQLFNALTSCAALLLTMTGSEWRAALIACSVGLAALAVNWLLAEHYGMNGVAVGTCCSLIVWNVVLCVVGYQRTRIIALPILRRRVLQYVA
jgi:O-antigen/teichoic acid export membrane protein